MERESERERDLSDFDSIDGFSSSSSVLIWDVFSSEISMHFQCETFQKKKQKKSYTKPEKKKQNSYLLKYASSETKHRIFFFDIKSKIDPTSSRIISRRKKNFFFASRQKEKKLPNGNRQKCKNILLPEEPEKNTCISTISTLLC